MSGVEEVEVGQKTCAAPDVIMTHGWMILKTMEELLEPQQWVLFFGI